MKKGDYLFRFTILSQKISLKNQKGAQQGQVIL